LTAFVTISFHQTALLTISTPALVYLFESVLQLYGVNESRRVRWEKHVEGMEEMRNAYKVLIGKRQGKKPLVRRRRSLEDNIRMDLREIGWEGVGWIHLAQDEDQWWTVVNTIMSFRVP
jgi:hypothetical protein